MAKGKATGLWKGKVGMNVFYKITNSNNAQKQGIRERVIEVSNPKSYKQASQRYKMLPAQRIASALKEIVERGQQGVKYGAMSRNEFMSRALKMTTGFPYMEKDDPNIIPGEYQLTKGTLPEVIVTNNPGEDSFLSGLKQNEGAVGNAQTVGEASVALIAANPFLQNGDQITLVGFSYLGGRILSAYHSFILDIDSVDENTDILFGGTSVVGFGSEDDANNILIMSTGGTTDADKVIAAAVIISRANGANGYLRSNATLFVDKTNAAIAKYFNASGKDSAISSYEGDTTVSNNSNWPVDVDGDGGSGGGTGFVTISADTESEDFKIPEGATLRGTGRYAVGDEVTLEYVHAPGETYRSFENWAINGVSMPRLDENPWTFTAERSMTIGVNGSAVTPP